MSIVKAALERLVAKETAGPKKGAYPPGQNKKNSDQAQLDSIIQDLENILGLTLSEVPVRNNRAKGRVPTMVFNLGTMSMNVEDIAKIAAYTKKKDIGAEIIGGDDLLLELMI